MSNDDRDPIASSLANAGARPGAPEDIAASVRRAVEQSWRIDVERRKRSHRWRRSLQVAAAVLVCAGLFLAVNWQLQRSAATPVGIFLASRGSVDIRSPGSASPALGGNSVPAGTRVQTGADGLALLAVAGTSVRIGPSSIVLLTSTDSLELQRGRIYLDFGLHEKVARELRLKTPLATVEHLGTQFQARVDLQRLTVSVREGQVRLTTATGEQLLGARESADVDASGRSRIQGIQPFGEEWIWTSQLAPDFPIEGQSLAQFLVWFCRETGQRVDYASAAVQSSAQRTRLSGSIAGLSPQEALKAVIAATEFEYQLLPNGDLRVTMHATARAKLGADGTEWLATRFSTQD